MPLSKHKGLDLSGSLYDCITSFSLVMPLIGRFFASVPRCSVDPPGQLIHATISLFVIVHTQVLNALDDVELFVDADGLKR